MVILMKTQKHAKIKCVRQGCHFMTPLIISPFYTKLETMQILISPLYSSIRGHVCAYQQLTGLQSESNFHFHSESISFLLRFILLHTSLFMKAE